MKSRTLASSRSAIGAHGTSSALETESPLANSVTSCPSLTSSSAKYDTIRSVPPYSRGGTLSMSGAICAIFMHFLQQAPVLAQRHAVQKGSPFGAFLREKPSILSNGDAQDGYKRSRAKIR